MNKNKYLIQFVTILSLLAILPSVTNAAWWNPFSWFEKNSTPTQQVIPLTTLRQEVDKKINQKSETNLGIKDSAQSKKPSKKDRVQSLQATKIIPDISPQISQPTASSQSVTPSPLPLRQIYSIKPLGDLSHLPLYQQSMGIAAYNEFLKTPDLQYLTPEEQNELLKQILTKHVVADSPSSLRRQVQQGIDKLDHERQTYPIMPLGDLSNLPSDQQAVGVAAYNEFIQTPDLQYLTPQQQNELLRQIVARHVSVYSAQLDQQVKQRQDRLDHLNQLIEQKNALLTEYHKKIDNLDSQVLAIQQQSPSTPERYLQAHPNLNGNITESQLERLWMQDYDESLAKIQDIQLQKESIRIEYLNKINAVIDSAK